MAFAAPGTEEMTRVASGLGGALVGGLLEGVIVKMAPAAGIAAPVLSWGTLLGVPLIGAVGALMTRGMLGDLFQGVAAGGIGIVSYTLPEMLVPTTAKGRGGNPGGDVKLLNAGNAARAAQARAAAKVGLEF